MSYKNIPVLVLQNLILFPSIEINMEFDKNSGSTIIENSEKYFNGEVLLVNKEDNLEEKPSYDELLNIGILAKINSTFNLPNGNVRINIVGLKRVKVYKYYDEDNILHAKYTNILLNEIDVKEEIAYVRMLKNMIRDYIDSVPYTSNALIAKIKDINNLDILTDVIVSSFDFNIDRKKEYILEVDPILRAKMLIDDINRDKQIVEIELQIDEEVNRKLNINQKEMLLRERIKVIKEELGEDSENDLDVLKARIDEANLPDNIRKKLNKEIKKCYSYPSVSPEVGVIRTYIELVLDLPWNEFDEEEESLVNIEESLNKSHYGMDEVKKRILEYIAVKKYTNNKDNSPILCLVGPPGVGKTTLAISIANSLKRKYTKVAVGGIEDQADIVGHRRTYIGSMPGMIINGMKKAGVVNPVFIIDEIDKMTKSIKGDPASSLLEVLDKEQNDKFVDHYLEEEYDLSNVLFITTANYLENIPEELRDRLEIIEVDSYSKYEKINIAKDYLIPRTLDNYGIDNISFTDESINYIIDNYTKEAGVRELERKINTILRKIIKERLINNANKKLNIKVNDIKKYLGERILFDNYYKESDIGVVNGLSYTPYGGDVLKIEATTFNGNGELILTGSLGEVMKESSLIALNYIKSNAGLFKLNLDYINNKNIHIHFPEGAIKKEGPSAGIAITTTILSILLNTKVPANVAMTGEITLRGNILPIGGLREKIIGAKNRGIKKVFVPIDNKVDINKIDKNILDDLNIIYVENYIDIYNELFKKKKVSDKEIEFIKLDV